MRPFWSLKPSAKAKLHCVYRLVLYCTKRVQHIPPLNPFGCLVMHGWFNVPLHYATPVLRLTGV